MSQTQRFFLSTIFTPNSPIILTKNLNPQIFNQLTNVLRIKLNQNVIFLNQDQSKLEHTYILTSKSKDELIFTYQKSERNQNELPKALTLALCLPNNKSKLEFILQKSVELGISEIQLLDSDFSNYKHNLNLQRLKTIIQESAEQSERGIMPTINPPITLKSYLKTPPKNLYIATERSNNQLTFAPINSAIRILIGPEGGFSPAEQLNFKNHQTFSLGKRILRLETATIISIGIFSLLLKD